VLFRSKYGGFSPEKRTSFKLEAGTDRIYSIEPFWQAEKKIIRLRLDLPHNLEANYKIKSIRVIETVPAASVSLPARNAVLDANGEWRARVSLDMQEFVFVSLRFSTDSGKAGTISFSSANHNGSSTVSFPVRADGKMHTYNVNTGKLPGGGRAKDRIIDLRVKPTTAVNAKTKVEYISAQAEISGPPDPEITVLGTRNIVARAGRPEIFEVFVKNHGGETARLKADLKVQGAKLIDAGSKSVDVENGLPATLSWKLQADKPGKATVTLVTEDKAPPVTTAVDFEPPLNLQKASYVPVPKPAVSDYQVGVYYFPGWHTSTRWAPIKEFPERHPMLGWYREGDPEVADWQIKWAVEHGINFFLYDWYWNRGARHLEHGIHSALFNSRYQNLIKFCLLYANHNGKGSHSPEDFEQIARFWIDNYFKRPNYLLIEGKPVVVMFSSFNPANDMGVGKTRETYDHMRQMCRDAGLKGLYLVACASPATNQLTKLKEMGYDAISGYNWPGLNMTPEETAVKRSPFSKCAEGYNDAWGKLAEANTLKIIPPVCGGWDSRPWHGEGALARTERTPEQFKKHLVDCKTFLDSREQDPKLKMLFIEAWNEWGEGSYIEPHRQYGFGYLEAIREVFASKSPKPDNVLPADIGLGPYDLPETPVASAWDFTKVRDTLGWAGNVPNLRVENGVLRCTTRGHDPILNSPRMFSKAARFPFIIFRLKTSRDMDCQLFWTMPGIPASEATSVHFPVKGGDTFQDIKVRLADNPRWRGTVTSLRFDPGSTDGVDVAVESIRLVEN